MINKEYKHSDLTGKIIGCAMAVHSALGNGFQEGIYQRALEMEMRIADLKFNREFEMPFSSIPFLRKLISEQPTT